MASFAKGFEKQQRRPLERELQAKAINTIDALLLDHIYIKFFFLAKLLRRNSPFKTSSYPI